MFEKKSKFSLSFVMGIVVLMIVLSFTGLVNAEVASDTNNSDTNNIEIIMDEEDLNALNKSASSKEQSTDLFDATITINGTTYENVGIRFASQDDIAKLMKQNVDNQQQPEQNDNKQKLPQKSDKSDGQQSSEDTGASKNSGPKEMLSYLIQFDYKNSGQAYNDQTTIILSQMGDGMSVGGQGQMPPQGKSDQENQQISQRPEDQAGMMPQRQKGQNWQIQQNPTDNLTIQINNGKITITINPTGNGVEQGSEDNQMPPQGKNDRLNEQAPQKPGNQDEMMPQGKNGQLNQQAPQKPWESG